MVGVKVNVQVPAPLFEAVEALIVAPFGPLTLAMTGVVEFVVRTLPFASRSCTTMLTGVPTVHVGGIDAVDCALTAPAETILENGEPLMLAAPNVIMKRSALPLTTVGVNVIVYVP